MIDRAQWRAGGQCPADGCGFKFAIESDDEDELDVVGAAMMQAHSDRSHGGVPVSLYGTRLETPGELPAKEEAPEPEERSRLVN